MGKPSRCKYIYCDNRVSGDDANCSVCGYPIRDAAGVDQALAIAALPDALPPAIVDMHQIVPKQEGSWTLQQVMMDRLNIKHVLLQSVPTKVTTLYNNEDLRRLNQEYRNERTKLSVSQFADPRVPFVRRKLKRYASDGIRVIKLLPCLGYEPDNPKYDRFWASLEELKMTAMVHTGFITARHKDEERKAGIYLSSKFGRPIYFDRIARKFSRLKIILCHMGGGLWYEEAAEMVSQHDNVWGDVAGPGLTALKRILIQRIDCDWGKVFWGNDSPASCYGFNLRLLQKSLKDTARLDEQQNLLFDNGRRFCLDAGLADDIALDS